MSQDLRRERAGVRFETIAGASDYIAQLEAKIARVEAVAYSSAHRIWSRAGETGVGLERLLAALEGREFDV